MNNNAGRMLIHILVPVLCCLLLCLQAHSAHAADRGTRATFNGILESFDDLYPGICQEDKEQLVLLWTPFGTKRGETKPDVFSTVTISYRNIPSMSVSIDLNNSGQVVWNSDYNFAEEIQQYKDAPCSCDEARSIALDESYSILWSEEYSSQRDAFILRFGENPLMKENLNISMDFRKRDGDYVWDFWVTVKEFGDNRTRYHENGINVVVDAKTGEVVCVESDGIFQYPYLLFLVEDEVISDPISP